MLSMRQACFKRLIPAVRSLCNLAAAGTTTKIDLSGEWLSDVYPDMSLVSSQRDRLVDSLIKRIRVKDKASAEEKVDELKQCFDLYQLNSKKFENLKLKFDFMHKKIAIDGNSWDKQSLEYYDLKDDVTKAKLERDEAYTNLITMYQTFPNLLEDISLDSTYQLTLPNLETVTQNVRAPALSPAVGSQPQLGTYLTGQKAVMELELSSFTADYLEECSFVPVTFPSFLRREVTEKSGMSNGADADIYTLLTKSELHADGDSVRDTKTTRKPKVEDYFVFQARGLCDLTLMTFFLRRSAKKALPVRLYSIGNQYRMPYSGKLSQSKMGLFLAASKTKDEAFDEFFSGLALIERFWNALDINVEKKVVEHHQLAQHEAYAVEFVMTSKSDKSHVVSRMSLSCDYISRRLMAYSSYSHPKTDCHSNTFCHFTSGELIDINSLLAIL